MSNADKPAYPILDKLITEGVDQGLELKHVGMTKREEFAKAAMQSLLHIKGASTYDLARNTEDVCGDIAQAAIRVADELLKQLEKSN